MRYLKKIDNPKELCVGDVLMCGDLNAEYILIRDRSSAGLKVVNHCPTRAGGPRVFTMLPSTVVHVHKGLVRVDDYHLANMISMYIKSNMTQ